MVVVVSPMSFGCLIVFFLWFLITCMGVPPYSLPTLSTYLLVFSWIALIWINQKHCSLALLSDLSFCFCGWCRSYFHFFRGSCHIFRVRLDLFLGLCHLFQCYSITFIFSAAVLGVWFTHTLLYPFFLDFLLLYFWNFYFSSNFLLVWYHVEMSNWCCEWL